MPKKPVGELYTALGFNKHGKTELYRDLLRHLASSDDRFVEAPGAAGMVMLVFTLPSYDVVFKVIRDSFAPPKTTGRQDVLDKYRLVFNHTRAGRLADVQEFEHLSFPVSRFDSRLLERLLAGAAKPSRGAAPRSFSITSSPRGGSRRSTSSFATPRPKRPAPPLSTSGRPSATSRRRTSSPATFFPKNFGLTRHGRVVFYDYDEICFLTDVNFRELPSDVDEESSNGPSLRSGSGEGDVFPEEFFTFMGLRGAAREAFLERHADLLGRALLARHPAPRARGRDRGRLPVPAGATAPARPPLMLESGSSSRREL